MNLQDKMDESEKTLRLLAHQVGVKCGACGQLINGYTNIAGMSYIQSPGSKDFIARPFCERCVEIMVGDGHVDEG